MNRIHKQAIVNSALWAAAGDSIGWITELASSKLVMMRTGRDRITEPVAWKRRIGGRNGVDVDLCAGTYSDDTQLRLAVCRSIRGNGVFDAEAFARIELTVWQGYALGAGRGTKAAASNLAKRNVDWFSNFFAETGQKYTNAGGNGAAMRIQPHVWCAKDSSHFVLSVMRDAVITHGHAHGFCGAVLHAIALRETLVERRIPDPDTWLDYLDVFSRLPDIIKTDRHLEAFWRPAWEQATARSFDTEMRSACMEFKRDIEQVQSILQHEGSETYEAILKALGCLDDRYRGSGFKTALAACALAYLFRDRRVEDALVASANVLNSDTDTIATMAGALLGGISDRPPEWEIQDRNYIEFEAQRLAAIGRGELQDGFAYPDIAHWQPPGTQSDAVAYTTDGLVVVGLGAAEQLGEEYAAGNAVWQWLRLSFGQTVLAKRRCKTKGLVGMSVMPGERRAPRAVEKPKENRSKVEADRLPFMEQAAEKNVSQSNVNKKRNYTNNSLGVDDDYPKKESILDDLTNRIIKSNFDNEELGKLLNKCIDESGNIEDAIAFAAIVAKAKLARRRKNETR